MARSSLNGLDGALMTVLTKFGDNNAKIRGEASATLSFVADASCVGPSHVAAITMKALPKKQQNAPKPIAARLGLLTELIERYGLRDNTGLSASAGERGSESQKSELYLMRRHNTHLMFPSFACRSHGLR